MDKDLLKMIALIIVLVGALNWGLVGLLSLDLVALIFGAKTIASHIIYILVGAAAVYYALLEFKLIK